MREALLTMFQGSVLCCSEPALSDAASHFRHLCQFRTNILAFSGGGKNPRFQPNKAGSLRTLECWDLNFSLWPLEVVLWDDRHTRVMAELSFKTTVKSVRPGQYIRSLPNRLAAVIG